MDAELSRRGEAERGDVDMGLGQSSKAPVTDDTDEGECWKNTRDPFFISSSICSCFRQEEGELKQSWHKVVSMNLTLLAS